MVSQLADGSIHDALVYVSSLAAVRACAAQLLALARSDELLHWRYDAQRLPACAAYVASVIRQAYPALDVPWHSRWRHFQADGVDRLAELHQCLAGLSSAERTRCALDLVITSVLLDAGAGAPWRYVEAGTGRLYQRSEGLAVASLRMFLGGRFSSQQDTPWQADSAGLQAMTVAALGDALQVTADNPLVGLDGRAALLRRLGARLAAAPQFFGATHPRLGHLYDALCAQAPHGVLSVHALFRTVLESLGPIWPGRLRLGGVSLGDVWQHPQVTIDGPGAGLVPLHKLSQWLVYSLIEPLQAAGLTVTDHEALTALAEYRNGGLLVDSGVLSPKRPEALAQLHPPSSALVVEWRALTVALLDELAPLIRQAIGGTALTWPLGKLLEGGTWRAGRQIALARRADGTPPLRIASDGTVF